MNIITLVGAIGITILITLATFLFYQVPEGGDPTDKTTLLFMIPTVVLGVCASAFFLGSLRRFKESLRLPYALLSASIILMPTPGVVVVLAILFNLYETELVGYLPYVATSGLLLAGVFMYLGMQRFSSRLAVRSFFANAFLAMLVAVVVAVAYATITYYADPRLQELPWVVTAGISVYALTGILAVFAAVLAKRMRGMLGESYRAALLWLMAAFMGVVFVVLQDLAVTLYLPQSWVIWYFGYTYWPYLLANFLFMCAGYSFWNVGRVVVGVQKVSGGQAYIESITYVSGLVSEPKAIDVYLDKLRIITSRMSSESAALSSGDKQALVSLYYTLEDYLLNKESLRKYTRENIRSALAPEFKQLLQAPRKAEGGV